jgi:hypothetical protein
LFRSEEEKMSRAEALRRGVCFPAPPRLRAIHFFESLSDHSQVLLTAKACRLTLGPLEDPHPNPLPEYDFEEVQGFKSSRVQGIEGSRVRGFKGSRVQGFKGSRV